MPDFLPLEALGKRICICGPSNAGKSTLAVALGKKLRVQVVHLDQLRHLPNTNWKQRPDTDFAVLHDSAIEDEAWIIEGNYSRLMPQRMTRSTGIILLGDNRWANLGRYFRRTLLQRNRAGVLEGGIDRINREMIDWILKASPEHLKRYREDLPKYGRPMVNVYSMRELRALFRAWGLER
jgi:adenylate kinase family enzyme